MTTSRRYTLITPRLDRTGPCNVAVDIGHAAAAAGWQVTLLHLGGEDERGDLHGFSEVRRFHWRDLFALSGVVHTHCLRPDLLGWLLAWNRNCTVLTTLHNYFLIDLGFDHAAWKVRIAWAFWRRAIAGMHHRVCISGAMLRYYRRLLPGVSFDLAYNFRSAAPATTSDLPSRIGEWLDEQRTARRTSMAYVGSLSRRKNLRPLLRAMANAPELALVLCGQGPELSTLQQTIAEHGLGNRVLLAGQVRHPEAVLSRCDMLVLPSLAEGLPLAVIEAMRAGCPSLLSNIAVHRELATLGAGLTFDHRGFVNFRERARALAQQSTPAARQTLISLWEEHFSAQAGFAQYERLVGRA